MNLGERIYRLRIEGNMSQGDLAEALDVSRQSISKWENNSAVPELDKLVKLSAIFNVTLDELVKGERPTEEPKEEETKQIATVIRREPMPARKIAGIVLFCMAFLVVLVCMVAGGLLEGLILAIPFLLCGAVCFLVKRYPGLYCAWVVYYLSEVFFRYATGVHWKWIFRTFSLPEGYTLHLIVAWILLLLILLLVFCTVMAYRKDPVERSGRNKALLVLGWVLFIVLNIPVRIHNLNWVWILVPLEMLRTTLLAFMLSLTVRWIWQIRLSKNKNRS